MSHALCIILTKFDTTSQIEMVRSCDEKRGRKLHEKNYDGRGQRTPQSRTTEEGMGDIIQQDMKSLRLKKEHNADRKKWRGKIRVTDPSLGGINTSRKEI